MLPAGYLAPPPRELSAKQTEEGICVEDADSLKAMSISANMPVLWL